MAAGSTLPALAVAREHLGGDEAGLQQRPRRKAARERAEERGRARRVGEPPDILHEGEAVDVDVVRGNHLQETQTTVRAPEAALLNAAPRRLRDAVCVEHLVDHDGAGFNLRGDAAPLLYVARPDARCQAQGGGVWGGGGGRRLLLWRGVGCQLRRR